MKIGHPFWPQKKVLPVPDAMIAVVDDEALVRSATVSLLRSLGYQALAFGCGDDFLACAGVRFDCLVTDVQMPGMTGLDLHKRLRDEGRHLPVVLVTAFPTPAVGTYAAENDVIALLEKPVESNELIDAVQKSLSGDHPR